MTKEKKIVLIPYVEDQWADPAWIGSVEKSKLQKIYTHPEREKVDIDDRLRVCLDK